MQKKPKISIISSSKNTGRFARETIESIMAQSYPLWEHIIVDAVSTDETLDVIRQYPHIRLISEVDIGFYEGIRKGLAMAKGEYVMLCCISDGYIDRNWFKKCVDILDNNPEIALVWGFPQYMSEYGTLNRISYDYFFDDHPPKNKDFIYYWLKTHFYFPEGNFCVRKYVIDDCFPLVDPKKVVEKDGFLSFNFKFNTSGYLPYFIPVVASYGRTHHDSAGKKNMASGQLLIVLERYHNDIEKYTKQLLKGEIIHQYRDGFGNLLPDGFDPKRYKNIKVNPAHSDRISLVWKVKTRLKRIFL